MNRPRHAEGPFTSGRRRGTQGMNFPKPRPTPNAKPCRLADGTERPPHRISPQALFDSLFPHLLRATGWPPRSPIAGLAGG